MILPLLSKDFARSLYPLLLLGRQRWMKESLGCKLILDFSFNRALPGRFLG